MSISFTELNTGLPDILSSGRHVLYFPNIPGTNNRSLTLANTQVTVPTLGVGHVRVRLLGHSIGFSGGLNFDNSMLCSFYEVSDGTILKSLVTWHHMARNRETGARLPKSQYAANADLDVINVIGNPAFTVKLHNMFPVIINWPELAASSGSAPTEFQVTFNVDSVEFIDGTITSPQQFVTENADVLR